MGEINVVLVDMPAAARGCVLPEADGSYTIYVNAIYNIEQQREIYCHEMTHVLDGHTHQHERPVADIEHEAQSRSKLVARIREAEERGLPLEMAIFRGYFFEGETPPFFSSNTLPSFGKAEEDDTPPAPKNGPLPALSATQGFAQNGLFTPCGNTAPAGSGHSTGEEENEDSRLDALFARLESIEDDWIIQLENEYHRQQQYEDFFMVYSPPFWPAN